jgi:hypothetical protein
MYHSFFGGKSETKNTKIVVNSSAVRSWFFFGVLRSTEKLRICTWDFTGKHGGDFSIKEGYNQPKFGVDLTRIGIIGTLASFFPEK